MCAGLEVSKVDGMGKIMAHKHYLFYSCLRNIDGRSGGISLSKATKTVSYLKPAEPSTTAKPVKPTKPANPACVHVAASGVRTARSWWGTTNRSQRERLTQLRACLGGEAARGSENPTNSQTYYAIDSCLRSANKPCRSEIPLNRTSNMADGYSSPQVEVSQ